MEKLITAILKNPITAIFKRPITAINPIRLIRLIRG
jgi:ABC-type microcin C transport system duplicated ATPase subunit YejF